MQIIVGLLALGLVAVLLLWHIDHADSLTTLSAVKSKLNAQQQCDFTAQAAMTQRDSNIVDLKQNIAYLTSQIADLRQDRDFDRTQLKSTLHELDRYKQQSQVTSTNAQEMAAQLAQAQKLNQDWQAWGAQQSGNYNKLLGYYHDMYGRYTALCAQYNTLAAKPPPLGGAIQFDQLTGDAARELGPRPPGQTVTATVQNSDGSTSNVQGTVTPSQ